MGYAILEESTQQQERGTFTHDACGSVLRAARVLHPIHDGPFPMSGSGNVHVEEVPYCPKCETPPDSRGNPIKQDPSLARERDILDGIRSGT